MNLCKYCGKEYKAEQRYLNRGQGLFCSLACAGKYRHEQFAVKEPNAVCSFCGIAFWRKPNKSKTPKIMFCCKDHQSLAARKDSGVDYSSGPLSTKPPRPPARLEQWLAGNNEVTLGGGETKTTRTFVKKYLLATRGDKCERCGFNEHGPFGSIIQMDHKDGNCFNNDPSNLQLLCPNCHAMTPTYGSRNKGSGRAHRRKASG